MEKEEAKRKRIAFATSVGVHLLLVLFFLLSMAWRAPDPPLPEFGIELNFGDSPEGSGDVQPETSTASDSQPQDTPEVPDDDTQEQQEETAQEVVPSNQESVVTEPKEEKPAVVEKPKVEEKKEDANAVYKPAEKTGNQPVSEGDDKDKTGDKGDPKGVLDPNAAYTGKPGGGAGGDGIKLDMAGWAWEDPPSLPTLPDNESGKVEFEIQCDETGAIIGIKTLKKGLSPTAERILTEEIRKNSLVWQGAGTPLAGSTGKVIINLRVN